ncbi:glycosyl transferase family group 2-domain-containing protein [Coniella lustricola]|uniref:Glycosyl transferase family group 2-domain-containing protein n=1 Tax=Coniella lustricola TaxID=2025994 RepID=A0A2T3A568_9PEZI|nr:glycosyl transferase family group 2-domain-containing protein [Coniella lustricola]
MVNYLANRVSAHGWIPQQAITDGSRGLGVLLRQSRGTYACCPESIDEDLLTAAQRLNVGVLITLQLDMLHPIIAGMSSGQTELMLKGGRQLQVVESLAAVSSSSVRKYQYAAILRKEGLLLVWQDEVNQILAHAQKMEDKLLNHVWGRNSMLGYSPAATTPMTGASPFHSTTPSVSNFSVMAEKSGVVVNTPDEVSDSEEELDGQAIDPPESINRPVMLHSAFFVGMGICLAIILVYGLALGQIVSEIFLDGNYTRLALVVVCPLLMMVGLFFFQVIMGDLWQIFGPIGGLSKNSRMYSCIKPNLRQAYSLGFEPPHITIQMPVYKEGMDSVIIPTVRSLQAAISHYESRGGTASIFINDDGMRAVDEQEAQIRRDFYHDNDIGWVARPKHGDDGYMRKGKFKKASNMNFALNLSQQVEAYLQEIVEERAAAEPARNDSEPAMLEENDLEEIYATCLQRALRENTRAMAGGNIRMGEFILLVDSDTRVPVDCLLYAAAEMFLSPEVAVVQHSTAVMQITYDFFENAITFFTNMVYTAIRFSIGCGEVGCLVGHNAFLRWAAVQDAGVEVSDSDGRVQFWSPEHVSEDFDLALRLQIKGSTVRVASYHGDGFKEGVSLTLRDEYTRWQKYAYGVSEMVFHPFYLWPTRGPITPLLRKFLGSGMQISSKVSVFGYICSYFAIGVGMPMTVLNYFLVGWFSDTLDHFYTNSWKIFISLLVVFNLAGGVALATIRYRTGERSFLSALFENAKWTLVLAIFFSGLSFHVSMALLAHLFKVDMQWGSTAKEAEASNFFQELPKTLKTFKYLYIFVVIFTAGMIYLSHWAPRGWTITDFTAIVPMAVVLGSHALAPLVLNPSLMIFSY